MARTINNLTEDDVISMIFNSGNSKLFYIVIQRTSLLDNFLKKFDFPDENMEKEFINTLILQGKLTINELLLLLFRTERFDLMEWVFTNPVRAVEKAHWSINQEVIDEFAKNSLRQSINLLNNFITNPYFITYLFIYLSNCHSKIKNEIPVIKVVINNPIMSEIEVWIDIFRTFSGFKMKIDNLEGNSFVDAILNLPFDSFKKAYTKLTLYLTKEEKEGIKSLLLKKITKSNFCDINDKQNYLKK